MSVWRSSTSSACYIVSNKEFNYFTTSMGTRNGIAVENCSVFVFNESSYQFNIIGSIIFSKKIISGADLAKTIILRYLANIENLGIEPFLDGKKVLVINFSQVSKADISTRVAKLILDGDLYVKDSS